MKDQNTGKTENEDQYREKYSVNRKPTQKEKEQLVGKDNVDKCIWDDIIVLDEKGTGRNRKNEIELEQGSGLFRTV